MTKGDSLPTVWSQPPHTKVKHDILVRYLAAWFGIFGSSPHHNAVNVLDGFAGPGRYENGEPGSPVLALNTLLDHQSFGSFDATRFTFVFNEWDPQRFASLQAVLADTSAAKTPWPPNVRVHESNENFQVLAQQMLDSIGPGKRLAPTFAFIDPFGYRDVPMSTIRELVSHRSCELFIYFDFNSRQRRRALLSAVRVRRLQACSTRGPCASPVHPRPVLPATSQGVRLRARMQLQADQQHRPHHQLPVFLYPRRPGVRQDETGNVGAGAQWKLWL